MAGEKVVAVTACVVGMAHSRLAAEALRKAAKKDGIDIQVELHGYAGVENPVTKEQIDAADGVLWACDVAFPGRERFDGVQVLEVRPKDAIKDPSGVIAQSINMRKAA